MKKTLIHILIFATVTLMAASCVYPFEPKLDKAQTEPHMVIFANLCQGPDQSTVTITSTVPLLDSENDRKIPLDLIDMQVEDSEGRILLSYDAIQTVKSSYPVYSYHCSFVMPEVQLQKDYRLKVKARLDEDILSVESDWIQALPTPKIDSLYAMRYSPVEARILVDASAAQSDEPTAYFKWDYREDWEITAHMYADIYWNTDLDKPSFYPDDYNDKFYCWRKHTSSEILVSSTRNLNRKKVKGQVVKKISMGDDRMTELYRIIVSQKQISSAEYRYWENLQTNSSDIGGLFSPQPSEMDGNIHCVSHPEKKILGFASISFSVCDTLYISPGKYGFRDLYPNHRCDSVRFNSYFATEDGVPSNRELYHDYHLFPALSYDPYSLASDDNPGSMIGAEKDDSKLEKGIYWTSSRGCIDCTTRGTKNKPEGWPNNHR